MIDEKKLYREILKMEDLARQRVLDTPPNSPAYLRYVMQLNERTAFKHMVMDAPKLDTFGEWVSVSERLPQADGEYLVYFNCGDDAEEGYMIVPFWTDISAFGVYQDRYDSMTLGFLDSDFYECETAVAWMPLPEAYKEE